MSARTQPLYFTFLMTDTFWDVSPRAGICLGGIDPKIPFTELYIHGMGTVPTDLTLWHFWQFVDVAEKWGRKSHYSVIPLFKCVFVCLFFLTCFKTYRFLMNWLDFCCLCYKVLYFVTQALRFIQYASLMTSLHPNSNTSHPEKNIPTEPWGDIAAI